MMKIIGLFFVTILVIYIVAVSVRKFEIIVENREPELPYIDSTHFLIPVQLSDSSYKPMIAEIRYEVTTLDSLDASLSLVYFKGRVESAVQGWAIKYDSTALRIHEACIMANSNKELPELASGWVRLKSLDINDALRIVERDDSD